MRSKLWRTSCFSRALALSLLTPSGPPPSPLRRLLSTVAVKKVTRSNFEEAVEELRGLVRESDFVAFDLEMSGVTTAPWRRYSPLDDPHVHYLKAKNSAEKFAVLQFGVCPFRWDPSTLSFVANPAQKSEAEQALFSTSASRASLGPALKESIEAPSMRTADILFSERMKSKFLEWRDGILMGCAMGKKSEHCMNQFQTISFKMRPAVLLDGFSSHQHKLIQLVINAHFKDLVYIQTNAEDSMEGRMVVYSSADGDKTLLMNEVQEDFWRIAKEKLKSAVGFLHIIDLLAEEQKLIVGHSCILDILHMHDKFLGPVPPTMAEFAHSFHTLFPHLIDTKHILESCEIFQYIMNQRGGKSLSSIFVQLCPGFSEDSYVARSQPVKIEVPFHETGPWNSGAKHEAGYDAFMTGCIFIQECAYMGIDFKILSQPLDLSKHEKLQKYKNLACMGRKNEVVIDLKAGVETPPSVMHPSKRRYLPIDTANIIVLWGFSPKIKPSQLKQCLSKVYGPDSVAAVLFLDESAALVQFRMKDFVRKFLDLKASLERNNNLMSALHPLAMLLDGGNTRAADYMVYREICRSSVSRFLFAEQAEAVGIGRMTKKETDDIDSKQSNANSSLDSMDTTAEKIGLAHVTGDRF